MRVLVALADARGSVLSRDDFLRDCWDSRIVGDDAINRAVAEVRRLLASAGAGFEVETVARVGYRLSGIEWSAVNGPETAPLPASPNGVSRRAAISGSVVALAALGGAAALFLNRRHEAADALIERGKRFQASDRPELLARAGELFRQAIADDPSRADAWGWLAAVAPDPATALAAADRALALDPKEPNARTVMTLQRRDLDDWTVYDDALIGILRDAPSCALALSELTLFYQSMGRCRDSLAMNERAVAVEPFNPSHQARRAMKHWIFGDISAADRVANRALQLWPEEITVWNARLIMLAYTDRAAAALALVNDAARRPTALVPSTIEVWRSTIAAIASRAPGDLARAVDVNLAAAKRSPGLAANAIMAFSHLGLLDEAYLVAEGLLTQSGSVVQQASPHQAHDPYSRPAWGRTQFLFIPACDAFRNDVRFARLCQRTGHVAYWRKRGIWPDPFVRGVIDPAKLG